MGTGKSNAGSVCHRQRLDQAWHETRPRLG
jgi:hypothetical protein